MSELRRGSGSSRPPTTRLSRRTFLKGSAAGAAVAGGGMWTIGDLMECFDF